MMGQEPDLGPLLDAVLDHARKGVRRLEDRALNRRREALRAAEEHVAALESAADDLGRTRGRAVEASAEAAAEAEVQEVLDGAFARLLERFARRVRLALEELPRTDRYPAALQAWAREAAAAMDGPSEVFAAPEHREAVYEALLAADAADFRVLPDRRVTVGFVVRDLDGRTVIDRRPDALLDEHAGALEALLREAVPPPPGLAPPGSGGSSSA